MNVSNRDLPCSQINEFLGVFNSTTNFIIGQMEAGGDFDSALREAQARGIAETDPSLDIDGDRNATRDDIEILQVGTLRTNF
jgi:homoserine dehydrogenase